MRRRLTAAILLLYPRRVRKGHGAEIVALIEDLIAHDGRSRARLFMRLAIDGLVQRIASAVTVWTVVAALAATSFGGLAVSEFAAASALKKVPRTAGTVAPAWQPHQTPRRPGQGTQSTLLRDRPQHSGDGDREQKHGDKGASSP